MLYNERLHVLVVDRGKTAEHGTIFPSSRFSEEGGDKVAEGLRRFASAAEAHFVSIVGTIAAGLKVSSKIYS